MQKIPNVWIQQKKWQHAQWHYLLKIIYLLGGAIFSLQEDSKIQILIPKKAKARVQKVLLMLENSLDLI